MLRRFETRARQRRLTLRIETKFRSFWPPVKIRGGRFAKFFRVTFWRHLGPNHWYTFDGAQPASSRGYIGAWQKKSSEVKYKGLSDYRQSGLNYGTTVDGPIIKNQTAWQKATWFALVPFPMLFHWYVSSIISFCESYLWPQEQRDCNTSSMWRHYKIARMVRTRTLSNYWGSMWRR